MSHPLHIRHTACICWIQKRGLKSSKLLNLPSTWNDQAHGMNENIRSEKEEEVWKPTLFCILIKIYLLFLFFFYFFQYFPLKKKPNTHYIDTQPKIIDTSVYYVATVCMSTLQAVYTDSDTTSDSKLQANIEIRLVWIIYSWNKLCQNI